MISRLLILLCLAASVSAETANLTRWTEAVVARDNGTLMLLKEELGQLFDDVIEKIGRFVGRVQPLEQAFTAFQKGDTSDTNLDQVLDLIPRLQNVSEAMPALVSLKKLEWWLEERLTPESVTPVCKMRDTLTTGNWIVQKTFGELEKMAMGLTEAAELLHELGQEGKSVSKVEQVGRLAVAYYSRAGKASDNVGTLGALVIVIINIGGVND